MAVLETKKKDGLLHNQKRLMTGRKRTNHEIRKIKCLNRISAVICLGGGRRALGILFVVLLLDNLVCVGDRLVESPDGETTHTLRPLEKPNDP